MQQPPFLVWLGELSVKFRWASYTLFNWSYGNWTCSLSNRARITLMPRKEFHCSQHSWYQAGNHTLTLEFTHLESSRHIVEKLNTEKMWAFSCHQWPKCLPGEMHTKTLYAMGKCTKCRKVQWRMCVNVDIGTEKEKEKKSISIWNEQQQDRTAG